MENLFRLLVVRPAVSQDPEQPSIELEQETDYQDALRAAVANGTGREYAASGNFVGSVDGALLAGRLDEFADRLDALDVDGDVPWATVRELIEDVFGQPAEDIVHTDGYCETVRRLRDSLIAIKILQQLHSLPIERLVRQLRTAELIVDAAEEHQRRPGAPRRGRYLALPIDLGLTSRLSTRDAREELQQERQALIDARQQRVGELLTEHEVLRGAVAELSALDAVHFRASDRVASPRTTVPDVVSLTEAVTSAGAFTRSLREQQRQRRAEGPTRLSRLARCHAPRHAALSRKRPSVTHVGLRSSLQVCHHATRVREYLVLRRPLGQLREHTTTGLTDQRWAR